MPLTGDFKSLHRLSRTLSAIATKGSVPRQRMVLAVANAVKVLTREQFDRGIGPDGTAQAPIAHSRTNVTRGLLKSAPERKKAGAPGLQSEKLARGAVGVEVDGDRVHGSSKNPKWSGKLEAHQDGHTFPARGGVQRRGAKGQLVSKSGFQKRIEGTAAQAWQGSNGFGYAKIGKSGSFGRVRASVQRTKGGERTLPARPIYPAGGAVLTARWEKKISECVSAAIVATLAPVKK